MELIWATRHMWHFYMWKFRSTLNLSSLISMKWQFIAVLKVQRKLYVIVWHFYVLEIDKSKTWLQMVQRLWLLGWGTVMRQQHLCWPQGPELTSQQAALSRIPGSSATSKLGMWRERLDISFHLVFHWHGYEWIRDENRTFFLWFAYLCSCLPWAPWQGRNTITFCCFNLVELWVSYCEGAGGLQWPWGFRACGVPVAFWAPLIPRAQASGPPAASMASETPF